MSSLEEEASLVERAQEQDKEAWSELYERYFDRVYRYMLARLRQTAEAEDLTEQVFLRALESIHLYKWRGVPFGAWLFRIAHNLVVDSQRRGFYQWKSLSQILTHSQKAEDDDPQQIAETRTSLEEILKALDKLTAAQKQVVELRFIADLSIEETARLMGKRPGAVKALQHSAILSLRKIIRWSDEDG